jgi:hypothetical protein
MIVYGDGIFFFAIVPEIPNPKHHEIQEFAKNYHISAMKIKKCSFFNTNQDSLAPLRYYHY